MEFAVNYSTPAAELVCAGRIQADRWKVPAWPELIAQARSILPVYVHFPLRLGKGTGDAIDDETGEPADWEQVERLLAQTGTRLINFHLSASVRDYPGVPEDSADPELVERIAENLVRDTRAVVARLGAERVIVENLPAGWGFTRPAVLPQVIRRVVEETNCGLLLDLSHARISAGELGMEVREYISALPVRAVREIHITGVQRFDRDWVEQARRAGLDDETLSRHAEQWHDHMPMTAEDWDLLGWALEQIQSGRWPEPWAIACEYGGIGGWLQAVTRKQVLSDELPLLYAMIKQGHHE